MRWVARAVLFVLVGWLAAQSVVAAAGELGVLVAEPAVLHALVMICVVAGLFALLDWGRTAEYRIRQTVEQLLREREDAGR